MTDELPEGWASAKVEQLLERGGLFDGPFGSNLKTSDYAESGVRVIRLENIANLRFVAEKETWVTKAKFEELKRHSVGAGDIIFGSFVDETVRVCLLPKLATPAIAKADCFCIRPMADLVDSKFLVYQLGSTGSRNALIEQIHGATRPRINTGQLRALAVALPPLAEQRRIVAKVDALLARVNAARERLEKLPSLLKRLRQAMLATTEDSGANEDGWDQVSFGDLLLGDGPQNGLYKPQSAYGDGVPIVRIDDFHDGVLRPVRSLKRLRIEAEEVEKYRLREGEILINRVNSLKFLGKPVLVPPVDVPLVFESNMMRCRVDQERLVPAFALFYFLGPRGSEELRKNAKHAVNQASINQQDVMGIPIPLPPIRVQTEIVARIRGLLAALETIEVGVAAARARADKFAPAILTKAFAGDLVPTEANLASTEGREFENAEELLRRVSAGASAEPSATSGGTAPTRRARPKRRRR